MVEVSGFAVPPNGMVCKKNTEIVQDRSDGFGSFQEGLGGLQEGLGGLQEYLDGSLERLGGP